MNGRDIIERDKEKEIEGETERDNEKEIEGETERGRDQRDREK